MNALYQLRCDVCEEVEAYRGMLRAPLSICVLSDTLSSVLSVLDRFIAKREEVTVRSLGGSLEIGRPNNEGGYDYWVSAREAPPMLALMSKRTTRKERGQ